MKIWQAGKRGLSPFDPFGFLMHLMIFLVSVGALVTGVIFIANTYADYQAHFIGITATYFFAWLLASRLLVKKAKAPNSIENPCTSPPVESGYLKRFAKLKFSQIAAIYIAGISLFFTAALLVSGHTFRAGIVCAFGLSLAAGMAVASESPTK